MMRKKWAILGIAIITVITTAVGNTAAAKKRGWLGVSIVTVNEDVQEEWDLNTSKGVLVTHVSSKSPADDSGIERGDVIVKYEGRTVNYADQLQEFVRKTPPEEVVKITVNRDGKTKDFNVSVGKKRRKTFGRRWSGGNHGTNFFMMGYKGGYLGIDMYNMTEGLREYFKVAEDEGVLVVNVVEDSPAEKAGFKSGDIITKVGKRVVENSGELRRAISRHDPDDSVEIEYVRDKKKSKKKVKLGDREDYEDYKFRCFDPIHKGFKSSFFFDSDEFDLDIDELQTEIRNLKDEINIDLKNWIKELNRELRNTKENEAEVQVLI